MPPLSCDNPEWLCALPDIISICSISLWVSFKTDLWFLMSSGHTLRKFYLFGNKVSSLCAQDGLEPLG